MMRGRWYSIDETEAVLVDLPPDPGDAFGELVEWLEGDDDEPALVPVLFVVPSSLEVDALVAGRDYDTLDGVMWRTACAVDGISIGEMRDRFAAV